jgi:GT2 family glycosyltransferase
MLLSDDVLPTPGCFQSLFNFLTEYELPDVGAIQIPYWTVDDLMEYHPELMESRTQAWWDFGILTRIPRSPWWDYNKFLYDWHGQFNEVEVKPRPYANVHATGFLLNSQVWRDVGGFSPDLAVYDEDISVRIWLNTPDKVVIRVPGPPLVHIHGTATYSGFPEDALKRFDGEANKAKAWGAPVLETHRKCITAQEERGVKWQLK